MYKLFDTIYIYYINVFYILNFSTFFFQVVASLESFSSHLAVFDVGVELNIFTR